MCNSFLQKRNDVSSRTSSRGRSPLVSQTTGSIYSALMKFRGHRHATFKRSDRPTTSNSKVDGWERQWSLDSEVNLQAARPRAPSEVTRTAESEVDKPFHTRRPIAPVSFDVADVVRRNDRWRLPQQESIIVDGDDRARKKYLPVDIVLRWCR